VSRADSGSTIRFLWVKAPTDDELTQVTVYSHRTAVDGGPNLPIVGGYGGI
jgi:hypothetical protein